MKLKKALAAVLSAAMIVTSLPAAFAEDSGIAVLPITEEKLGMPVVIDEMTNKDIEEAENNEENLKDEEASKEGESDVVTLPLTDEEKPVAEESMDRNNAISVYTERDSRPILTKAENEVFREYILDTELVAALDDEGTLTISGNGAMPDFANSADEFAKRPWDTAYWENSEDKETVQTAIKNIKKIVIEDGITSVGMRSFYGGIGYGKVTDVELSASVKTISHAAFMSTGLKGTVIIPETVEKVVDWAYPNNVSNYIILNPNLVLSKNDKGVLSMQGSYTVQIKKGGTTEKFSGWDESKVTVSTHDDIGSCGNEDAYYTWDADTKTLNVYGNGRMNDYSDASPAPWANYEIENVVINSGITYVGSNAFKNNTAIKNFTIQATVTGFGTDVLDKDAEGTKDIKFLYPKDNTTIEEFVKQYNENANAGLDENGREFLTAAEDEYFKEYVGKTSIIATLKKDGTLYITGEGEMPSYTATGAAADNDLATRPWDDFYWTNQGKEGYESKITKIVIGNGITRIGERAFYSWDGPVTSVEIADSVTTIGHAAFMGVNSLKTIIIPETVTYIANWALTTGMSSIIILNKNTALGVGVNGLMQRYNNNSIIAAKDSKAFEKLSTNEADAGKYTATEYDKIGACGVAPFSSNVYYTWDEESKTLNICGTGEMKDYSETEPAPWANITTTDGITINVGAGITKIGTYAFADNNVSEMHIASTVSDFGDKVFGDTELSAIQKINFVYASNSAAETWLKANNYIDESQQGAYYYSENIAGTNITATLDRDGVLTISGSGAMPNYNTTKHEDFATRPWDNRYWQAKGDNFDYGSQTKKIVIENGITSVGNREFYSWTNKVTSVRIPDSVTTIGHAAFMTINAGATVVVPENVTYLHNWVYQPGKTKNIIILNKNIPNIVLAEKNGLINGTGYTVEAVKGGTTESQLAKEVFCKEIIYHTAMGACGNAPYSSEVYYIYDEDTKTLTVSGNGDIRDYAEGAAPWSSYDVEKLVISDGITKIGNHAFSGNTALKTVMVADSVASVGENIFKLNEDGKLAATLRNTKFICDADSAVGQWLTAHEGSSYGTSGSCGENATWSFDGNKLTISGTGAISDYSDSAEAPWAVYADLITEVEIKSGITAVGDNAFKGLDKLSKVTVPATVASLGSKAFSGCTSLSSISLPENTETIADDTFENCAVALVISGYATTKAALEGKLTQGTTTITVNVPTRLKVLFVGNSFSQDGVNYLDNVARAAGVEETLIANLFHGSETIKGYNESAATDKAYYSYTERGTIADTSLNKGGETTTLKYGIQAHDWDIIVIQPYGSEAFASMKDSTELPKLIQYINENKTNPKTKLAYYMIWSRPADFNGTGKPSSETVWNNLLNAYDFAEGTTPFSYFVPVGTAVENARFTYLEEYPVVTAENENKGKTFKEAYGSGLNRDSVHLNDWGKYIAALTFTRELTGLSIDNVTYKPNSISDNDSAIAKKVANAAFDNSTKNAQDNVSALTYAKIGETCYSDLASAVAAANAGDTIELYGMCKNDTELEVKAGVTIRTYGSEKNHEITLTNGGTIDTEGLKAKTGYTLDGTVAEKKLSVDPVTGKATETAATVKAISVKTNPAKTEYYIGEDFNAEGLVVTVTYDDDVTKDVAYEAFTSDWEITGYNKDTDGEQTVTVKFAEKETTVNVKVKRLPYNISLEADKSAIKGAGEVVLTIKNVPDGVPVAVKCNDTSIRVEDNKNETFTATLPNITKEYVFTVRDAEGSTILSDKYELDHPASCTVNVTRKKSSSSSDTSAPTYGVSVGKTENGKLTVDPANAAAGEKVTITAKPDSGYQLDKITVKDKNNSNVKLTKVDDNEYTFTMPSGKVSVDATFAEKDTKDDNQNNNTETKENPFVDVKASDWFYGSVLKAYEAGWMSGTSAITFAPNASTTRGMIVSVLYRLEGSPEAGDSTFTDVKAGAYYAKAVAWAAENGIVGGYGDGTFGPNDEITREQLAAILYRYAQFKGYDVSKKADLTAYSDYAQVSAYAKDAVAWANATGILSGTSATTLSPRDHATRAQVAAILVRFTDAFQA